MARNARSRGAIGPQDVSTPPDLFALLGRLYPFVVDLAARPDNALLAEYVTPEENSLEADWSSLTSLSAFGWLNPPYNEVKDDRAGRHQGWAAKMRREAERGARFVALVPASLEANWYADYVHGGPCEVRILKGRLKFPGYPHAAANAHMIIVWDGRPFRAPFPWDWRSELKELYAE